MVPLANNTALGIAIMSYNGQLNFGLARPTTTRCADLGALADELRASIEELGRPPPARAPPAGAGERRSGARSAPLDDACSSASRSCSRRSRSPSA